MGESRQGLTFSRAKRLEAMQAAHEARSRRRRFALFSLAGLIGAASVTAFVMTAERQPTDSVAVVDIVEEPAIEINPAEETPEVTAALVEAADPDPGPDPGPVGPEPIAERISAGDAPDRLAALEAPDEGRASERTAPTAGGAISMSDAVGALTGAPATLAPSPSPSPSDAPAAPRLRTNAPAASLSAAPRAEERNDQDQTILTAAVNEVELTRRSPGQAPARSVSRTRFAAVSPPDPRAECRVGLGEELAPVTVYYEPQATKVPPEMRYLLSRFIEAVPPACRDFLLVEGHADAAETGDAARNEAISRRRAVGVVAALAAEDLLPPPERVLHFGDEAPARTDDAAWNMRVVVSIDLGPEPGAAE